MSLNEDVKLSTFWLATQILMLRFHHALFRVMFYVICYMFIFAFLMEYQIPTLSNLVPRALQGVFVRYLWMQKGYEVYFHDIHCYVIWLGDDSFSKILISIVNLKSYSGWD